MRIRKCLALVGAILIFLGCLIIYRIADHTLYVQEESQRQIQTIPITTKIKPVYKNENRRNMNKISIFKSQMQESRFKSTCKDIQYNLSADIQMSDLYKHIKFDNIDGGVWKQGWNIEINPKKWVDNKKLRVFIVPHSHNDPGWLKTFEDYYTSETRNILNNMLRKLILDPKKKFIWAEISFFSLWWDELSEEDQEKVRRLIQGGQLEIVTGGWVMNDEANTHYYSMITQLTEGHLWMKANILMEPKNGWTIDPFGESPVMAYLLRKMGVQNLVIQRVHYSIKKYFAQKKNLEFRWRQLWDENGSYDVLTHMTPFYSYDIPHTCGPDPKICCQFDFKRLPGNGLSCPWREPPKPITKKNVAHRAQMLLDQYRKKAELYRTNVILVPLGDDFRYQYSSEWDNQFENYYRILRYVNTNPHLHAEIKFGTLSDFFNALTEESRPENFPTLTGDFFTYADRDDHYWSGYYTSRPYYKRMDRILMSYHRAAEILFSLGWSNKRLHNRSWLLRPQTGFAKMLRDARRSLSLFQHHDGITGTARDNVMEDYAQKMIDAINYSKHIIQQLSHYLLSPSTLPYLPKPEKIYFEFDDQKKYVNDLPTKKVFVLAEGESKTIVLFNSLTYKRKEMISIFVSTPLVEICDSEENVIPSQVSPIFLQDDVLDEARYEVSFIAEVPALGLTTYKLLKKRLSESFQKNMLSKISVFNLMKPMKYSKYFENIKTANEKEFLVENHRFSVMINGNEHLVSIKNKEMPEDIQFHLDFVRYLARKGTERSGAYLFLPDGEAAVIKEEYPLVRVYEGSLFTRVELKLSVVKHIITMFNGADIESKSLEIVNFVDILNESNYELAMKVTSDVKSGDEFYSDLNGFQIIKRTKYEKLPIQGNFYPMPTSAYIEDNKVRITILSGQPLGVSSLSEGELEVLQDRRLKQDDNRGLGQGVLDNKITPNIFRILVEKRVENCHNFSTSLSISAYKTSQNLLNPLLKMISTRESFNGLQNFYTPVANDLGIDLHLVSARTFDEEEVKPSAGLVFYRPLVDICFLGSPTPSNGIVNLYSLLPNNFGEDVKKTSLSFLQEEETLNKKEDHALCYMNFLSLILS